ncbi:MAG: hypothetical protein JWP68_3503 [Modestobacter sp.]|nr:hypothetical protein [Modestobacter sp.]
MRAVPLTLLALLLAGCDGPSMYACPAIGYSSSLVVELAPDWPADHAHSVTIECDEPCGVPSMDGGDAASTRTAVLAEGAALFDWVGDEASVVVTVRAADGAELAKVDAELEWVRVGGSEECGGPLEATVTIPAP